MAGRRGNVTREEYKKAFDSFQDQILKQNRIVKPSDIIWEHLSDNILTKSKPKSIYSAAIRWFNELDKRESDVGSDNDDNISVEMDNDGSFDNSVASNPSIPHINFNVHLSAEVWKTIAPIPKSYENITGKYYKGHGRQYLMLKPGVWTNVLLDKISEHRKNIICNISFKRNKVYVNGSFYVTIAGKCVSCGASITGFVKEKPRDESDSVKFCFRIINFNEKLHTSDEKTVRNSGEKAKAVFSSTKSALNLHQQMATNTEMFQDAKGRQFSLNAIRCGKSRKKTQKKISTCPYTAISYLQAMNCYINTIHDIAMSPFVVVYISPNQIRLFNAYKRANPYTRLSGDSSGGFAHKLARPDGKLSGHIFLYSFVISDCFQVSVASAFTEKQDMSFIQYLMNEWLRLGGSIPNEFIADMSPALLGAAVQSFGRKSSMVDYINCLFNLLTGVEDKIPNCFVRIDIAHFIKSVTTCKALKTARFKHKDFFVRSVALMIKMNNLEQARRHILEVLVVALSSTEGLSSDTGDDTPCETHKRSIIRKIKGIAESDDVDTLIESSIDQPVDVAEITEEEGIMNDSREALLDYVDAVGSTFNQWITDIETEAKLIVENCDDGDRDNLMFNPSFAVQFRKICKLMLLWSAMCCPIFSSPYETSSSAHVECDFKNVKSSLRDVIPCRVDVFVQKHLELLDGAVKTASKTYARTVDNKGSESTVESDDDSLSGRSHNDDVDFENQSNRSENNSNDHIIEVGCVACANNDIPGGAHRCFKCGKNVHILPGCSLTIGQEEGYGEERVCITCSKLNSSASAETLSRKPSREVTQKPLRASLRKKLRDARSKSVRTTTKNSSKNRTSSSKPAVTQSKNLVREPDASTNEPKKSVKKVDGDIIYKELNHKEQWVKRKKTKRSVYLKPSPYWDLTTNVNKKVKLGFLTNGNLSKIVHHVNKVPVVVGNTCCFDSIAQILAGAYAYFESFRETCEGSQDGIFEIAILLAKNSNLKKVNNLRASLLHRIYNKNSFEMVLTTMLNNVLKHTPSYNETSKCMRCKYHQQRTVPIVGVDSNVYKNNMANLEKGIVSNFPDIMCKCKEKLHTERQFGEHFFVELPTSCSDTLFEETAVFQIKDIPLVLNIFQHKYVLFGIIIFKPPFLECDIGHYTCAIRLNNKWEIFDDYRSQPYSVSSNAKVVLHGIMFVKSSVSDEAPNEPSQKSSIDDNLSDPTQSCIDLQREPDDDSRDPPHKIHSNTSSLLQDSAPPQVSVDDTIQSGECTTSFEVSEHRFESFYRLYHQGSEDDD